MLGHPQTLNAGQPLGALAGGHKVKHRAYRGVWPGRGRVTPEPAPALDSVTM